MRLPKLLRELVKTRLVTGDQYEIPPIPGEDTGQFASYSFRSAGDECPPCRAATLILCSCKHSFLTGNSIEHEPERAQSRHGRNAPGASPCARLSCGHSIGKEGEAEPPRPYSNPAAVHGG